MAGATSQVVADGPGQGTALAASAAHAEQDRAAAAATASLAAMGTDMLKAVSFINGGAAVATLLCVGQVVGELRPLARALVGPLALFGFGLTVAAFAIGFAYFAQRETAREIALRSRIAAAPFVTDSPASREAARRAERFWLCGFAAVMVSVASAVVGFGVAGASLWWGLG